MVFECQWKDFRVHVGKSKLWSENYCARSFTRSCTLTFTCTGTLTLTWTGTLKLTCAGTLELTCTGTLELTCTGTLTRTIPLTGQAKAPAYSFDWGREFQLKSINDDTRKWKENLEIEKSKKVEKLKPLRKRRWRNNHFRVTSKPSSCDASTVIVCRFNHLRVTRDVRSLVVWHLTQNFASFDV